MKVIVTGSSKGIGLSTAVKFLSEGHDVMGIDIEPYCLLTEVTGFMGTYRHYCADVSCKEALPRIYDADILINNAGVQYEPLNIPVNLMGVINCCEKYALQPNIKSIVNVASVSAHNGAEFPLYTASKGGVLAYTKWLAQEVAKYGATANSLSPGGVITPMTEDIWNDQEKRAAVLQETLLNKWATAKEIAEWIYFLLVKNTVMTGQIINIDGELVGAFKFIPYPGWND